HGCRRRRSVETPLVCSFASSSPAPQRCATTRKARRLGMRLADLGAHRLRLSASFVLLGKDELAPGELASLGELADDPDVYGVLKHVGRAVPAKSVSREAALLLFAIRSPRRIPRLLEAMFHDDVEPIRRLIVDGIVEIEHGDVFLSGSAADVSLFRE